MIVVVTVEIVVVRLGSLFRFGVNIGCVDGLIGVVVGDGYLAILVTHCYSSTAE